MKPSKDDYDWARERAPGLDAQEWRSIDAFEVAVSKGRDPRLCHHLMAVECTIGQAFALAEMSPSRAQSREQLRDKLLDLGRRYRELRADHEGILELLKDGRENAWHWLGAPELDGLETLSATCAVVIHAGDLRALIHAEVKKTVAREHGLHAVMDMASEALDHKKKSVREFANDVLRVARDGLGPEYDECPFGDDDSFGVEVAPSGVSGPEGASFGHG